MNLPLFNLRLRTLACGVALACAAPLVWAQAADSSPPAQEEGAPAEVKDPCVLPHTAASMVAQFRMLDWKETDYVIQHEPGMKKVWDKIPQNYQQQIQANPHAFPWARVTANRSEETTNRVADLLRDARARSIADAFAAQPWSKIKPVLLLDAQYKAQANNPRGTPLEAAAKNPKGFDWMPVLTQRDLCQLTPLKEAAVGKPAAAK